MDAVVSAHPLQGGDGRFQGRVMAVQRWDRRPVIADRVFEQRRFALGVYDPDLRFLWVNESACRVMAHSEQQLLGEKYREASPELDDAAYTNQLSKVARTGEPARLITVSSARSAATTPTPGPPTCGPSGTSRARSAWWPTGAST
ncbi:PAS domain-containing protein [Streptacidiphilus pinicola]|uniref:PAS domain-containing protein n=1 Tax=Streptacidiphilus pinicola TaxID=2219663 RepID=UPI001FB438E7|nr:PAS domain-containing protein [Streptacidiphilus pinicola]